jgi:hypothetical protein
MEVTKLHSQGQSIREIARQLETSKYWVEYRSTRSTETPANPGGVFVGGVFFQKMFRLSESGVFRTNELATNAQIFPSSMVSDCGVRKNVEKSKLRWTIV